MRSICWIAALVFTIICTTTSVAGATVLTQSVAFNDPAWSAAPAWLADSQDYEIPAILGARTIGHPGEPLLPVYALRVLLPPGEEISSVQVANASSVEFSTHVPAPAQREYPFSFAGPISPDEPKAAIYASAEVFPADPAALVDVQIYRGHRIAYINLFPLRVRPASRTAEFTRQMTVAVTTTPSATALAQSATTYRDDAATRAWLTRNVANPELADQYRAATAAGALAPPPPLRPSIVDPADTYLYVIVTSAALASAYQPLADSWTERGLPATIVDPVVIVANYPGRDNQEKIRNFVIDAYQNWETDYILFGGDIDVIPDRDCYCYVIDEGNPTETNDLCCELYYQGLDGTWNDDGDNRWGEVEEADLVPEIDIARSCTDNVTQVQGFVTKTLRYELTPVVDEIASAAFLGEYLWEGTYGDWYMEEIRLGADTWGYETAGAPPGWRTPTYYEESGSWSGTDFVNEMNSGTHMAHHLGHANYTYDVKVYTTDVPRFTNDGVTHTYSFGYSQGCDAGGFDSGDCIMEEWVKSPTGFVGWVGNTRYGFGVHYTTNGSSQYYHRQFADAMWGESINELASANNDSRVDNINYIEYETNRWVHYEITAFGDPALPLWIDTPRTPELEHAPVFVLGEGEFQVTVRAGVQPVAGARVCMWDEVGDAYAFGVTDITGQVTLNLAPEYPGTMHIVVSDANLLVTEETIPIIPNGPYIVVQSHSIDDTVGGNGDGACDSGETIELYVTLRNIWTDPITGVYALLSSADEHITITDDRVVYGDIPGGGSQGGQAGDHFTFSIGGDCPDQEQLDFVITIVADGGGQWDGEFAYSVDAPALAVARMDLDDTGGDGDGILEPGESAVITVALGNDGHNPALDVAAMLLSGSSYLTITQPSGTGGDIAVGGEATLAPPFEVALAADSPSPRLIHCLLNITGSDELTASLSLDVPVGGFKDDMENGEGGWTHEIVTAGFVDQWHYSTQRNHTAGGTHSWKFGAVGSGTYANLADGALITEPISIADNVRLTFWHWIDAEVSGSYQGYCYDGGIVEMSIDDGAWQQITPEGGYPYRIRTGGTPGPFPAETPAFSGSQDWIQETFNVTPEGSSVRFRFRFGSDGAVAREGWYVDDVQVASWAEGQSVDEGRAIAVHPVLEMNRPNPFSAGTAIRFTLPATGVVKLEVLDAQGRVARVLIDGQLAAGVHSVTWDGRDDLGHELGSGVFFCRLTTAQGAETRRMVAVR